MKKTYNVYDSKAEAYLPPFYRDTAGQATRDFEELVNEEKHIFNRHAADFTLFETGTWDENTALATNHKAQINLGVGITYKIALSRPEADQAELEELPQVEPDAPTLTTTKYNPNHGFPLNGPEGRGVSK